MQNTAKLLSLWSFCIVGIMVTGKDYQMHDDFHVLFKFAVSFKEIVNSPALVCLLNIEFSMV